ncbi:ClpX C4-type zinc finger protein [Arthrobacter rhombi]|uniref:ClpX C4-type zinc finger protein n=1 Tax=Arthrobacter rhombi TaxID=71253 RepID=UPI0031D2A470
MQIEDAADTDHPFMCSFCLRPRDETGWLVGAPSASICRSCSESALELLRSAPPEPVDFPGAPWDRLTERELLAQLPRVAHARDDVEHHLRTWVNAARRRGISWAAIGESLGMSRQSAWERFRETSTKQDGREKDPR